jgi:hypothetical protein
MKGAAVCALGVIIFSAGCAAPPLDVPTGSLPLKCATFTRVGAIFLNLTCSSKETEKPVEQ